MEHSAGRVGLGRQQSSPSGPPSVGPRARSWLSAGFLLVVVTGCGGPALAPPVDGLPSPAELARIYGDELAVAGLELSPITYVQSKAAETSEPNRAFIYVRPLEVEGFGYVESLSQAASIFIPDVFVRFPVVGEIDVCQEGPGGEGVTRVVASRDAPGSWDIDIVGSLL